MDHVEKIFIRQVAEQAVMIAEAALDKRKRLQKLMHSPYFGCLDFIEAGREEPLPVYIGVHAFFDEEQKTNVVFDWRAPIASLFYDYETGAACYDAPSGEVAGEIALKRQYRSRRAKWNS